MGGAKCEVVSEGGSVRDVGITGGVSCEGGAVIIDSVTGAARSVGGGVAISTDAAECEGGASFGGGAST